MKHRPNELPTPAPPERACPPNKRVREFRGKPYFVSHAHPLADVFPWPTDDEVAAMAAEMADPRIGQKNPIDILPDGRILDGRSRELACLIADVPPHTVRATLADSEVLQFVRAKNLTRRHLTESQRAMIAADLANLPLGSNQFAAGPAAGEGSSRELPSPAEREDTSPDTPAPQPLSQAAAAAALDVSPASVRRASRVRRKGHPKLKDAVSGGKLDVKTAAEVAGLPIEEQQAIASAADPKKAVRERKAATPAVTPERLFAQALAAGVELVRKELNYHLPLSGVSRGAFSDAVKTAIEEVMTGAARPNGAGLARFLTPGVDEVDDAVGEGSASGVVRYTLAWPVLDFLEKVVEKVKAELGPPVSPDDAATTFSDS